MQRRLFSLLAIPMVLLAQCAPDGCAPTGAGGLQPGAYDLDRHGSRRTASPATSAPTGSAPATARSAPPGCGYWALRNFNTDGDRRRRRRAGRAGRRRDGPHRVLPGHDPRQLGQQRRLEHRRARRPPHLEPGRPGPQRAAAAVRPQRRVPLRQLGLGRQPARPRRTARGLRVPARQQGRHPRRVQHLDEPQQPVDGRLHLAGDVHPRAQGQRHRPDGQGLRRPGPGRRPPTSTSPPPNFGLPGCPF